MAVPGDKEGRGKLDRGLVQVYTGAGKGKTTAALGLALRVVGHGLKVIMIQFLKRRFDYGEYLLLEREPLFQIVPPSKDEIRSSARQTLAYAEQVLHEGQHDVVILDDILNVVDMGLVSTEEVLRLMRIKPQRVELILTGQRAAKEIVMQADLVTEMLMIKHPFVEGAEPRKGIDY